MDKLKKMSAKAQQTINEKSGHGSKSDFDEDTNNCLNRVEAIKIHTEQVLGALKKYSEPPMAEKKKSACELVAQTTNDYGAQQKETNKFVGESIDKISTAYIEIAKLQHALLSAVAIETFDKLKNFIDVDLKNVKTEKEVLRTKRSDLSKAKSKKIPSAYEVDRLTKEFDEHQVFVRELCDKVEKQVETDVKPCLVAFVDAELIYHQACVDQLRIAI